MIEVNIWNAVKNAVGDAIDCHWGIAPKNADYPLVILNIISESGQHTLAGRMPVRQMNVQVDAYAKDMEAAAGLKAKLISLDGLRHEFGIVGMHQTNMRYSVDTSSLTDPRYRYSFDFRATYNEGAI